MSAFPSSPILVILPMPRFEDEIDIEAPAAPTCSGRVTPPSSPVYTFELRTPEQEDYTPVCPDAPRKHYRETPRSLPMTPIRYNDDSDDESTVSTPRPWSLPVTPIRYNDESYDGSDEESVVITPRPLSLPMTPIRYDDESDTEILLLAPRKSNMYRRIPGRAVRSATRRIEF